MTVPDRFRYNRDLGQFELTHVSVRQLNTITLLCVSKTPGKHLCTTALDVTYDWKLGVDMYGN